MCQQLSICMAAYNVISAAYSTLVRLVFRMRPLQLQPLLPITFASLHTSQKHFGREKGFHELTTRQFTMRKTAVCVAGGLLSPAAWKSTAWSDAVNIRANWTYAYAVRHKAHDMLYISLALCYQSQQPSVIPTNINKMTSPDLAIVRGSGTGGIWRSPRNVRPPYGRLKIAEPRAILIAVIKSILWKHDTD